MPTRCCGNTGFGRGGGELLAPTWTREFGGNQTAVQGVADCILVENGRGTVIDYKTDYVKTLRS